MQRIMVIGCPGAGKTTLSRALAERTGLPLIHLDQHYWSAGWTPSDRDDWAARQEELCADLRWIIDGNYTGSLAIRLARADAVVVLEKPRSVCLWNAFKRSLTSLGRVRPDMAAGCPERFSLDFLAFIWGYQALFESRVRPLLDDAEARGMRVMYVGSVEEFWERVTDV